MLKLTTDKHEASRGLSATAELLVNRPTPPAFDAPLMGASTAGGVLKNHDFRPISCFIWEMIQDRAIVTMEGE